MLFYQPQSKPYRLKPVVLSNDEVAMRLTDAYPDQVADLLFRLRNKDDPQLAAVSVCKVATQNKLADQHFVSRSTVGRMKVRAVAQIQKALQGKIAIDRPTEKLIKIVVLIFAMSLLLSLWVR